MVIGQTRKNRKVAPHYENAIVTGTANDVGAQRWMILVMLIEGTKKKKKATRTAKAIASFGSESSVSG